MSYYKKFWFATFCLLQFLSSLLVSCTVERTVAPPAVTKTSTPTATAIIRSSETPSPTVSTSAVPLTLTATVTTTIDPSRQWCDNFDDGIIDQSKWNLPTDPEIIYEQNGVLNFRVIDEQSRDDEAWAGLEAKQTEKLIGEITFTLTLESYGENIPGGVGIDVFLKDAEPVLSVDVGPGPNGPGGEFSFCPDFNAGYEQCEHPTTVPDKASLTVAVGTPIHVRLVGTGKDVGFYIDNEFRAGQSVTASIENFQFFIYADPESTLHATIDNACVTYASN